MSYNHIEKRDPNAHQRQQKNRHPLLLFRMVLPQIKLPSKNKVLIPAFQRLSKEIGKERVVWRYDPIFFSERYTLDYHCRYFEVLASRLAPYTEKCTISFLDWYRNIEHDVKPLQIQTMPSERQTELVERLAEIAER